MDRGSGIYEIVNLVTNHRYIGSTSNFYNRWKAHKSYLRNGKYKTSHFQRAWDKYGEDAFEFRIIVRIPIQSLLYCEQVFLNEEFGEYNSSPVAGSPNKGRKCSDEERAAMSVRMIGNKRGLGWHPTEEQRARMSMSRMGNTYSLGVIQSEETKQKKRIAMMGENHPNWGKKFPPERLLKMSISATGKKQSEETIRKRVESIKKTRLLKQLQQEVIHWT